MTENLIAFYKKHRLKIAYLLMMTVLAAPYVDIIFPTIGLREKLLSAIPLFLLFLLNDWRTEMNDRLKKVEQGLNDPDPPLFRRFPEMEKDMAEVMNDLVAKEAKITVKVIGVSSKFSRPFLQRIIGDLLQSKEKRKLDIRIGIVLTKPTKLKEWGLDTWDRDSQHSINETRVFLGNNKKKMKEKGISLTLAEYDNLPHWHGVMFNDQILFMGRTEWYKGGDNEEWQLRVGEVEYRKFKIGDSYGGQKRIERFILWHQRYLDRAKTDGNVYQTDDNTEIGFEEIQT